MAKILGIGVNMETIPGNNILVFYSSENTQGKSDATGAFIPESEAFADLHGVPSVNRLGIPCVSLSNRKRLEEVCVFIRNKQGIKWIAMFCHGYSSGLQFGLNKLNIPLLVSYLSNACALDLKMTLYACSTASESKKTRNINMPGSNNGYADKLRDALLAKNFKGGWIDAHLLPGHTTENPFLMRFYTEPRFEGDIDLPGGDWIISPKSPLWPKWKQYIQNTKGTGRFEFSNMSTMEIYQKVG